MAQDHFWTPPDTQNKPAAPMGEAVLQMCAWGLFAFYIYTSADPCISMHVVILSPMLQQSQMQGVQRLHL